MKKSNKKFETIVESYGLYTHWDLKSRDLPEIIKFTSEIQAENNNEFGMIIRIKHGKGVKLQYIISHPPFCNEDGELAPDFTGEHIVTSNDYLFFIGDSIEEPVENKKGEWIIKLLNKNKLLLAKRFFIQ